MISDFHFLESTTGWIFAVTQKLGVSLIALEPLPPHPFFLKEDFIVAIEELEAALPRGPIAFISIGPKFANILNERKYYNLQFGREPWIDLSDFEPRGKRGKGVRAARNQALRAGIGVENWKLSDLKRKSELKDQIEAVHRYWKRKSHFSLEGFLLKTDPWKLMDDRYCFLARNQKNEIEGVLIATPIVNSKSWYLEDMWLRRAHARGIGELLTLEAMRELREIGSEKVSLGLVPLTDLNFSSNLPELRSIRPRMFSIGLNLMSGFLKNFYNADGLTLFRKRFNVCAWSPHFISVKMRHSVPLLRSLQWFRVVIALIIAHKPKIYFKGAK